MIYIYIYEWKDHYYYETMLQNQGLNKNYRTNQNSIYMFLDFP